VLAKKRGIPVASGKVQKTGNNRGKVLAVPVSTRVRGAGRFSRGGARGGGRSSTAVKLHPASLKITIRNDKVGGPSCHLSVLAMQYTGHTWKQVALIELVVDACSFKETRHGQTMYQTHTQ
jgi:hypothetical protein